MRRLDAALPRDAGTSLAELLVSMVVFGIVGAIVTLTVTVTLGTSRAATDRVDNLSGAQLAIDAMSKLIQTAAQPPAVAGATPVAAVFKATGTDLAFYGYDNPGAPPSKIEFAVVSGALKETITPSTNSGPSACKPPYSYGAGVTRTLATGVGTTSPVFSYYSQPTAGNLDGVALSLSGGSLSSSDMAKVELVKITLSVGKDTNPTVTSTGAGVTVSLPNHLVATPSLPGSAC